MAFKDQVVELVLRAKNMLSGETDAASKSVEELAGNAEGLQEKLRQLEDQSGLITQFDRASKAVDRTAGAYDRAQIKLDKLSAKLGTTGPLTERQAREFTAAQDAVDRAEKAYRDAEGTLGKLAVEADKAGIDVAKLSDAQRDNRQQTTAAKRAIEDYNTELAAGDGRLKAFGKSLASGAASFAAWGAAAVAAGAAAGTALLARMTANQADLARQTLAAAQAFGISTKALQEWRYAGESVGLQGDKVADIMKDVADKIGDAFLNGSGAAIDVIEQLNLDLEELVNLRPDEQLLKIAEGLNGLPKAAQVQILESLAGDAALLLPLLENNAQALRELSEEADKRKAILTDDELKKLADADRAFDRIAVQLDGFVKRVTGKLAPTFTKIADEIDAFLLRNPQLIEKVVEAFKGLVAATKEWAGPLLSQGARITGMFGTLGSSASGLSQTFIALFRGVQAFAAGSAEVFARVIYSVNNLYAEALSLANKVGLASDESVERANARLANLGQTVLDLEAKSEGYKRQMIEAGSAAATAFGKADDAGKSAADSAGEASNEIADLTGMLDSLKGSADDAATGTESLALKQAGLRNELSALVPLIKAAQAEFARDATTENQRRLQDLIKQYDALAGRIQGLNELSGQTDSGIQTSGEIFQNSISNVNKSLQDATGSTKEFVRVVDTGFGNSEQRLKDFAETTKDTADGVGASLSGIVSGWLSHISDLSAAASMAFERALGGRGAAQATSELEQRLSAVNNRIDEMQGRLRAGGGVGKVLRDWAEAGFRVEQSFLEQAISVENLTRRIQEGDRSVNVLGKSAEQIEQQFDLLDRNQLAGLVGAVQSVQREVDGLNDSLRDTLASLEQEKAALAGDTAEVERLRFKEREAELQDQINYARNLGDKQAIADAELALQLSRENYETRLKKAQLDDAERRKSDADRAAEQERNRQLSEQEERQDISRDSAQDLARRPIVQSTRTVRVQFSDPQGRDLGDLDAVDGADVDQLLDALERGGYLTAR